MKLGSWFFGSTEVWKLRAANDEHTVAAVLKLSVAKSHGMYSHRSFYHHNTNHGLEADLKRLISFLLVSIGSITLCGCVSPNNNDLAEDSAFSYQKAHSLELTNNPDTDVANFKKTNSQIIPQSKELSEVRYEVPNEPKITKIFYDGKKFYGMIVYNSDFVNTHYIYVGLSTRFEKSIYSNEVNDAERGLKYFAKTGELVEILQFSGWNSGVKLYETGSALFEISYAVRDKRADFKIIDQPHKRKVLGDELGSALASSSPNALLDFIEKHPESPDIEKARESLIANHFNVKVVSTNETSQRDIADKALLMSMNGACKDISKTVEISAKDEVPSRNLSIDVSYTLNRTYKPLNLSEPGDPIEKKAKYNLNSDNGFKIRDTIEFDCVLTSGRYHSAGLSLLGKLAGVSTRDSGLSTTLEKTTFSFKIDNVE